jgi:hypothetical protein
MRMMQSCKLVPLLSVLLMTTASAQRPGFNYDEQKVPPYMLPDPLVMEDGTAVNEVAAWEQKRRPEVLELFREHVYGRSPNRPRELRFEITDNGSSALDGKATRKQVAVHLTDHRDGPVMHVLIYLPNNVKGPVPLFVGMNFYGNHTIHSDPGITLSKAWMRNNESLGVVENRATEASRGLRSNRWPVETILSRGYGLATIYYGDLEPDHAQGWRDGLRAAMNDQKDPQAPDAWGAIGAWAYGLSRAMDYFEQDQQIDGKKVAVMGHSRLGKTSLWAGAQDPRFAIVISNESGCGGAALSRRRFGETVARINEAFPHWFCGNFKAYGGREDELPVDQHQLIALMAPRPVYVASAEGDQWADPRGEFLSAKHADSVYQLYAKPGLAVEEMPQVDQPVGQTIGYHMRSGKHDVTDYDWEQYLRFADQHFSGGRH